MAGGLPLCSREWNASLNASRDNAPNDCELNISDVVHCNGFDRLTRKGRNSKTGWELQIRAWLPPIGHVRLEAALRRMITVWHQSTARVIRMHRIRLLSYRSRGTLMSYGDHSAQRCFKSNAPIDRQAHDTHAQFFLPIKFSANSAPQLILKILLVVSITVLM